MVTRIFVEKKEEFAVAARGCYEDLKTSLQIDSLTQVRILNRYDVEGMEPEDFEQVVPVVFAEPQVDTVYREMPTLGPGERAFAAEPLPGQFDQRADSCAQCIQLALAKNRPLVRTALVYIIGGNLNDADFERVKGYLINPVESTEASFAMPATLHAEYPVPESIETVDGFCAFSQTQLAEMLGSFGFAMDLSDLLFCQAYFRDTERRDPTVTELRVIDTYWSDHCRHTTFLTHIEEVQIEDAAVKEAYDTYLSLRGELYAGKNKPITLMDLATIGAKKLKKDGLLTDLDESEEINACSVRIPVDVDGQEQDWLLMFKNETHNHPTEIEPFGGAATCLGGAIRDPLSGRSYVYQAMRVTGAGDPTVPVAQTMQGKLPQKKITRGAASGYSSYGNQIGLATGLVNEVYHPGYRAKRMEIGAVIAAAPAENVVRCAPVPGDRIILIGGKTGRDGCGGATGSSKSHTANSLESCGAEVQKGNPPEERKIQRLFRKKEVTQLIKRCNDFGAGGVSVAIGELAPGLLIDLDRVPKKYDGLNGTELAISESQERMAVVVDQKDAGAFIALAGQENLEATIVAEVTSDDYLQMRWRGETIVRLSRAFIDTNGASKDANVRVLPGKKATNASADGFGKRMQALVGDLNVCSQKGLVETFDSTIGAATVLMPFGGKHQLTPSQAMVCKIPLEEGQTDTCSVMAYGFDPYLSECDPFIGAALAVVDSVAKTIACGGSLRRCHLTFQEYFERLQAAPERWGKPFAALLGALRAQLGLSVAAIGGKDSMSGSFEQLDVPPTLVSFAVTTAGAARVVSGEFKAAGHPVYTLLPKYGADGLPDFVDLKRAFARLEELIAQGQVQAAYAIPAGGVAEAVFKMGLGNHIGFAFEENAVIAPFASCYGGFVIECGEPVADLALLGRTTREYELRCEGESVSMSRLQEFWQARLEPVFPVCTKQTDERLEAFAYSEKAPAVAKNKVARPRVLIPVFPGTNCEYDTKKVFAKAGADAEVFVIRNRSNAEVEEAVEAFAEKITQSQIIMIPGGFSGGDEPEGSAKLIGAFFRHQTITEAVHRMLRQRDGLMLGICNGFQALIKLGLVPFGEICEPKTDSPTLTFNTIGRHQSMMAHTRVCSNKSPWLRYCEVGQMHTVAVSHGEGRFIADDRMVRALAENGQIATQYVDLDGAPSMDVRYNPNGSLCAIEGITSPDGRILGKMCHSERYAPGLFQNIWGEKEQKLFQAGVDYFK